MAEEKPVTIILTIGKSDNGKVATLAFSAGLAGISMGQPTTIFLTGEGAVWGFHGSASGIAVQGFPPLDQLIQSYQESGGRILLCSVCYKTCSAGGPSDAPGVAEIPGVQIAGFTTVLELAGRGVCLSF